MRFLVVAPGPGSARASVLAEQILGEHPDAAVGELRAGDRRCVLQLPRESGTVIIDPAPCRWADLALGLGRRRAAWAALPWVVERLWGEEVPSPSAPLVVLDESFGVTGPLDELIGHRGPIAARPRHLDPAVGTWGGHASGLLVVSEPTAWTDWWKARVVEALHNPELADSAQPWWELPNDTDTLGDPRLCLSADFVREADDDAVGSALAGARLVDFAGLDPRRPWWFEGTRGEAVPLDDLPRLRELCEQQAALWLEAGWKPEPESDHVLVGVPATRELRAHHRRLLRTAEPGEHPPNPFVAGEVDRFLETLTTAGGSGGSGLNEHVDQLMQRRGDLASAFPHARWRDRPALGRWLWSHGLSEGEASLITLPEPPLPTPPVAPVESPRPFGVNLVGYLGADLGLGVAARRLQRAFDAAGIPHAAVTYDRTSSNQRVAATGGTEAPYHFNLLLITPDQLPLFVADVGEGFLAGHHNIGLWYWESDVVAPQQREAFGLVDQIWVATEYLTRAFEGHGLPVTVVPSPLVFEVPDVAAADRQRLGLDDRFSFLFSFDYLSVAERKNPLGLAEAYRRAFPDPEGGTALILKSINGDIFGEEMAGIVHDVSDRPDIVVRDELLPAEDRLALVAAADCYVSLHRSEGLGLTIAEAMAVGTPVIATAYSGNLDFMPEGSALLVPASEVEVGPGHYYPADGHWADPDLDAAAEMMRRVRTHAPLRRDLAAGGRRALEPFGYEQVGEIARDALLEAWNRTRG